MKVVLIHPGATDLDDQGRIKGNLDVPLNANGAAQVARTIDELSDLKIDAVYSSPCRCCDQTAEAVAASRDLRTKRLDGLRNVDHGLWHGQLIEEVKRRQPKVYRQWQDHPETVCPPQGESLSEAQDRVQATLEKLIKKHKDGTIAVVASEPLASLLRSMLLNSDLGDLWKVECEFGGWELIELEQEISVRR